MVNKGIVAARRSAELDQQYRANATGVDFGAGATIGHHTPLSRVMYDVCPPPASVEQQGVFPLWDSSLSACSTVPLQPLHLPSPSKSPPFLPSLRGLAAQAGLSFQYRLRFKGRYRRHRVGDDVSFDRKRVSIRLARRDSKRWTSGSPGTLSKQASLNLAHHRCVKPLPPFRATSAARKMRSLESLRNSLSRFDKPLPPLPSSSESPDEAGLVIGDEDGHLVDVIPGNERYHDTHSRMADDGAAYSDGRLAQEQYDRYADMRKRNVRQGGLQKNDHHLADGLDAAEEITTHKDNELPHYQLLDESTLMGHGLLTQEIFHALDTNNAPSLREFDSFRFPQSADAVMNEAAPKPRSRLRQHSHHQSLPHYNGNKAPETPSLSPIQASPYTLTASASASQSSSTTECKPTNARTAGPRDAPALRRPLEWIETSASIDKIQRPSTQTERQRRQYSHLRRSESCSFISHRPSLSFNSSKKDLLSLQMRRINKPDAKVNRLPEIQTTAGMGAFSVSGASGQTDSQAGTGTLRTVSVMASGCMLNALSLSHAANFDGRAMEDGSTDSNRVVTVATSPQDIKDCQMQISNRDRGVLDTILKELGTADKYGPEATTHESGGHIARLDGDTVGDEVGCESATADVSSNTARTEEPTTPATVSGDLNACVVDSGLSTALQTFSIDSGPIVDAGEIKRFVKRSHALQELEMTEESYVNDLDVLIHVHLRALETKAWFPQILHANMRRCVSGLLALHQEFLLRLRACKMDNSDRERHAPLRVYKNLAVCFEILNHDNYLYGVFCELRVRTINEINRTVGQAAVALLQKEGKELLAQQGRPKSRVDLKDCLIKPIQRICRYPLLLKEILRLTSLDDPEYQHVQQAHEMMKGMAQEMDETQRVVERKLLTEQFLRKLPDTNFPKKVSSTPSREHSNCHASTHANGHGNSNSSNASALPHPPSRNTHGTATVAGAQPGLSSPLDDLFEFDPSMDGIPSSPLTKAYAGTLGSIVLAGALEYVIIPDMPIRLKYYGCFLFETMLIIVKAKKSSLYEPRQWLPLRLCELHETTRLDGYTRFGWRIMFDQFRMDFGASCVAEQQVWMNTLRNRIQAAKTAYAKLPRDIAAFETIVSSLPWNVAMGAGGGKTATGSLGYTSARHFHNIQQSPSPSPSPWSTSSSAIPSPLMPPPPPHTASSTTMMMAMSSMVTGEPDKWNSNPRSVCSAVEGIITGHHDRYLTSQVTDAPERHVGLDGAVMRRDRIGGMARTRGEPDSSEADQKTSHYAWQTDLNHQQSQQQQQAPQQRQDPSTNFLHPSTPVPWLLSENSRPTRSHSFDVTRVFTSGHSGGIKHTQKALVQSMFKDISTESIWTTSTALQPSPQPASATAISPLTRRSSIRYSGSATFGYFSASRGSLPHSPGGMMASSAHGAVTSLFAQDRDDDAASGSNIYSLGSSGSSSTSLTSRLLRRRDSGTADRPTNTVAGSQDKKDWDRRRSSATGTIAATLALNFRKTSDSIHRSHPSIHDIQRDDVEEHVSVKARAELFEERASASSRQLSSNGGTASLSSSLPFRESKNIKASQSHQDLGSFRANGKIMSTSATSISIASDAYSEALDALSSAGEAARSRRIGRRVGSEGTPKSSSSHSLPLALGSRNSSTQSLVPHPSAEPRDGVDKLWMAMGRLAQKGGMGRGNHDKSHHQMDNTRQVSISADLRDQPSAHPPASPSSARTILKHRSVALVNSMASHGYIDGNIEPFEELPCHDLHRSCEADASPKDSSFTSSFMRVSEMSCMPPSASPTEYSGHIRILSACTDQSSDSGRSLDSTGSKSRLRSMQPPRLTLTPSVSSASCCSSSSRSSLYSITPSINDEHHAGKDRSVKKSSSRKLNFHDGYVCDERSAGEMPSSAAPPSSSLSAAAYSSGPALTGAGREQRRRSLSILQHITHSASQKFKTLIRSPSTLRRRTVMSLTPITMESASNAECVLVEEEQEQYQEHERETLHTG
ncbi:unnamed protein product [Mortierella alpina]